MKPRFGDGSTVSDFDHFGLAQFPTRVYPTARTNRVGVLGHGGPNARVLIDLTWAEIWLMETLLWTLG